jgi:hypothetical protein
VRTTANKLAAAAIDSMKEQLLIVFVKRLGGKIEVPVAEVDDTEQDLFLISVDMQRQVFTFEVRKKS